MIDRNNEECSIPGKRECEREIRAWQRGFEATQYELDSLADRGLKVFDYEREREAAMREREAAQDELESAKELSNELGDSLEGALGRRILRVVIEESKRRCKEQKERDRYLSRRSFVQYRGQELAAAAHLPHVEFLIVICQQTLEFERDWKRFKFSGNAAEEFPRFFKALVKQDIAFSFSVDEIIEDGNRYEVRVWAMETGEPEHIATLTTKHRVGEELNPIAAVFDGCLTVEDLETLTRNWNN